MECRPIYYGNIHSAEIALKLDGTSFGFELVTVRSTAAIEKHALASAVKEGPVAARAEDTSDGTVLHHFNQVAVPA